MAYILYLLMWRIFCISWCGVYIALHKCIAFPFCISLCGVQYVVSPDVACILFHRYIAFPDMAYILYFLMWHTFVFPDAAYNIWVYWYDGCIVIQTYIIFPGMAYIRFFLMWPICCISWCGVHCIVSPHMEYILFFRHQWCFLVCRTASFS